MDANKLKALISLLDDPDKEIYSVISGQLIDEGKAIIPDLERTWEYSINESLQGRIEDIIYHIRFKDTQKHLTQWMNSGADDLLEGAYLVAKHQYSELNYEDVLSHIDLIKRDVWLELNNNLTALEKVRVLNRIVYDIHGFTKAPENMDSPQYGYINRVLEMRKGDDISLGILYLVVAQKLNIPLFGVNFPNNFLLAYLDRYNYGQLFRDNVLFYVDPLNNGMVLSREELELFIKRIQIPSEDAYYMPCDNVTIVQRLVSKLIISYDQLEHPDKLRELRDLFSIIS